MHTTIYPIYHFDLNEPAWQSAVSLLRADDVLVAPTDTVYGVMCRYDSRTAIERLFTIKERPLHKPIPVLIGNQAQLSTITTPPLSKAAETLGEQFWPGPLTLILPAHQDLLPELTAGQSTVGVRMPDHQALRDLMNEVGPLAATSANRSGVTEAVNANQALEQLDGRVSLILSDDAVTRRPSSPSASTIVDLSKREPVLLRRGPISAEVATTLAKIGLELC